MINLINISKTYHSKKGVNVNAINDVSLNFDDKGMIFLTGKSGSGKSTLLHLIGSLDTVTKGEICINNKTINQLKSSEMDALRNSYVGFIFQDFNLLEEFNVYQNVELALNLQKKKHNKKVIENILNEVGLPDLGQRKINELSGGQKQRVAIARALIKDPDVILADEPTGNLDSETSIQIFDILKEISKNKLIIVVSHDMEMADKYADRIIGLSDGILVSDSAECKFEEVTQESNILKSRLPIRKAIKMALNNLWQKKIRLCFTILLVSFAFTVLGLSLSLTYFNIPRTHAETIINEKTYNIEIHKKVEDNKYTDISAVPSFTQNDLNEVNKLIKSDMIYINKVNEDNSFLTFPYISEENTSKKTYAYYDLFPDKANFLQYNDKMLNKIKLIGKQPVNSHEVVINKLLADYFINKGTSVQRKLENGKYTDEKYTPKTYDQIIADKKKIIFGSTYFIVSGILDEDLSKYESLKKIMSEDMQINPSKLYKEFVAKYHDTINNVIVGENFFDITQFSKNTFFDNEYYKTSISLNGNKVYTNRTGILNSKTSVFDGKEKVFMDSVGDNEIIIGNDILDLLYNNDYSKRLVEFIDANRDKMSPDESAEKFTLQYIKEKNLVGKTITLEVNDLYLRTQAEKTKAFDFKIIAVSYNDGVTYVSNKFTPYMRKNNDVMKVSFDEDNKADLERLFTDFSSSNPKYEAITVFSEKMVDIEKAVIKIEKIFIYCSIGFLVFAVVLIMNFIVSSINSQKKKIGILRAIGAKKSDILKIFFLESFIIGFVSFVISSVLSYALCGLINNQITKDMFFYARPVIFRIITIGILLLTLIVVISVSNILPILKASKMKPIDAINCK